VQRGQKLDDYRQHDHQQHHREDKQVQWFTAFPRKASSEPFPIFTGLFAFVPQIQG